MALYFPSYIESFMEIKRERACWILVVFFIMINWLYTHRCNPKNQLVKPSPPPGSERKLEALLPIADTHSESLLLNSKFTCLNCTTAGLCNFITEFVLKTPTLQASSALEYVVQDHPEWLIEGGSMLEFGVYSGNSIRKIATHFPDRTIHGFDSFIGLPEAWNRYTVTSQGDVFEKGRFGLDLLPQVPANVVLHKGWFSQTLKDFPYLQQKIALLHVDCDLYSSTKTVFEYLGKSLVPGSIIVFDELLDYPGYENHEILALYEFLKASGKSIEILGKSGDALLCPLGDRGALYQSVVVRIL